MCFRDYNKEDSWDSEEEDPFKNRAIWSNAIDGSLIMVGNCTGGFV